MTCPVPARLARAVVAERDDADEALLMHADGCPYCGRVVDDARLLRALAAEVPPPVLDEARRQRLREATLAAAEADLEAAPAPRASRRWPRTLAFAAPLLAAAAALLWLRPRVMREETLSAVVSQRGLGTSPWPQPHTATATDPDTNSGTGTGTDPGTGTGTGTGTGSERRPRTRRDARPRPTITAAAQVDYDVFDAPGEHRVLLRDGEVSVDGATAPDRAVHVVAAGGEVRASGARFAARSTGGALRAVRVFAGSVEITAGARVIVVVAGESWLAPGDDKAAAPAPTAVHFRAGWAALRAGRFADAARELEQAQGERGVEEDAAYWTAVAWARAGDDARAITAFTRFLDAYAASPRAGEAHVALASLLVAKGDRGAAGPHLDAARRDPDPRVRAAAARLSAP